MTQAHVNVEFGHFYADVPTSSRMRRHVREGERTAVEALHLARAFRDRGLGCSTSILIDNYNQRSKLTVQDVQDLTSSWPLQPDYLVWEADLVQLAGILANQLDPAYVMTDGFSRYLVTQGHDLEMSDVEPEGEGSLDQLYFALSRTGTTLRPTAPMSNFYYRMQVALQYASSQHGETLFSCPMLTAAWHLARLGVGGFEELPYSTLRDGALPFTAEQVYSVLPSRYLPVEAEVRTILSICPPALQSARARTKYLFV